MSDDNASMVSNNLRHCAEWLNRRRNDPLWTDVEADPDNPKVELTVDEMDKLITGLRGCADLLDGSGR